MLNRLKGWIASNTVAGDPNDRILILYATSEVSQDKSIDEMLFRRPAPKV